MTFNKDMFLGWVQNKLDQDQEQKEARNSTYLEQQKTQNDMYNALTKEPAASLFDSISRVTNDELSEGMYGKKMKKEEYRDMNGNIVKTGMEGGTKKVRKEEEEGKKKKKGHMCANHVEHAEWGQGTPIHGEHAPPDEDGYIQWYNVEFEHGIEEHVFTEDLNILSESMHENHDHHEVEESLGKLAGAAALGAGAYAASKLAKPENRKKVGDAVRGAANKFLTPERKEKLKQGIKDVGRAAASAAADKLRDKVKDKIDSKTDSKPSLRIAR